MITARAIAPRTLGTLRTRALTTYRCDTLSEAVTLAATLGQTTNTYVSASPVLGRRLIEFTIGAVGAFVTCYTEESV